AERVDRDATLADLALGHLVVGVVAVEGRQVEGGREAGLAVLEEIVEPRVRLLRRAVAGELTHRPELPSIPGRMDAAGERVLARPAEVAIEIETGPAVRAGERLDRRAGDGRPVLPPGCGLRERLLGRLLPALAPGRDRFRNQRILFAHRRRMIPAGRSAAG